MTDIERLDELEMRVTFQEDVIAQLNEALINQQRRIDELVAHVRKLTEQLEQLHNQGVEAAPYSAQDERPPHY